MTTQELPPTRPEDEPRTLIFVDMLGFAALTKRYPTRILDSGPDEHGWTSSSTTPLQARVYRFRVVLEQMFASQDRFGGVSAQVFSDCAYIDLKTSLRAARAAEDLMRSFIEFGVPVRMGIGRGTYYSFKHSIETVDSHMLVKALFAGTAVVNAHAAEQCGAKGCRILVHPSAVDDVSRDGDGTLMQIPAELKEGVSWELCYLPHDRHGDKKIGTRTRLVDHDVELVRRVRQMEEDSEPLDADARKHYTETLEAIERMRKKLGRGNSLEEAQWHVDNFNDEVDAAGDQGD